MEVYAPIAHRLGISNIKEELEDRSLHYLDPVGYETIRDLLNKHGDEFLHTVCHTIAGHLAENGIPKATIPPSGQEHLRHLPQDVHAEQGTLRRSTTSTPCASFWTMSRNVTRRWA